MTVLQMNTVAGLAEMVRRRTKGRLAELDMTQQELALKMGMSPNAMSQRLKGRMEFALSEVSAVAAALGTSEAYLLGLTDDRSRPRVGAASVYAIQDSNQEPAD